MAENATVKDAHTIMHVIAWTLACANMQKLAHALSSGEPDLGEQCHHYGNTNKENGTHILGVDNDLFFCPVNCDQFVF